MKFEEPGREGGWTPTFAFTDMAKKVFNTTSAPNINADSLQQVNNYIAQYSQHLWNHELAGNPEYVITKQGKVRSRSKNGKEYYPYPSYEGGAKTIGPGFKLNDNSEFTKKVKATGKASRDEIDKELNRRMTVAYNGARDVYNSRYGENSFEQLPQPVVNLLSNLAYRAGKYGFSKFNNLLDNVYNGDVKGINKEYNTKNKKRDKVELDIFNAANAEYNSYDNTISRVFPYFNNNVKEPNNYVEVLNGTESMRKKKDFGGILTTRQYTNKYLGRPLDNYRGNYAFGIATADAMYSHGKNNKTGRPIKEYVDQMKLNDINTFVNMQNKINNEVLIARGVTDEAKFGGMVGRRRKKCRWGTATTTDSGSLEYGSTVTPDDVSKDQYSADGEGIIGASGLAGASTGMGVGALAGGAASALAGGVASGTLLGAWGGPIGMGVGAIVGLIAGLFGGRKKKRQEEARRKEAIAAQEEAERQQTLGNMQNKLENDVARLRKESLSDYSEGSGFYAKLGGMIGRKKYTVGGQAIPNSNNSSVAYGQTHEQYNPATGETGIIYGDSEIEGGGVSGNKAYAGEVVRETPEGSQVFSNSIMIPGTRRTFAKEAKKLTDAKGQKEQEVIILANGIADSLAALDKSKTNKLKSGTAVRNIEKLAYRMNKARGEAKILDAQTGELFKTQEAYATALGLRDDNEIMRTGGIVKNKYPYGGYTISGIDNTALIDGINTIPTPHISSPKWGYMETGLAMNAAGSLFGMLGNALNARAQRKAIEFEQSLDVPKASKVDAVQYSTDYNINPELQELETRERRAGQYIVGNTSNVQTARNNISKLAIDAQLARNSLYAQKKRYQTQRYDLNLAERVKTNNINNQLKYEDALAEYNKAVGLNQQLAAVKTQALQGYMSGMDNLGQAFNNYAQGKLFEKTWRPSVTNYLNRNPFGFRCGGMVRRKRR